MDTMHDLPANDNRDEAFFSGALDAFACWLRAELPVDASFTDFERAALDRANQLVKTVLTQRLQTYSDGLGRDVWIDGVLHRRHAQAKATYFTLSGPIEVTRWTYRRCGERNGPTAVPVELYAGMIENATPACAFAIVHGVAKGPVRDAEADLRASHRVPPSRSKMDRLARLVGTDLRAHVRRLEQQVRAHEEVPREAKAINLSLDRTSIPMEEPELDSDGEPTIKVRYRMAYVGTVALTDRNALPVISRRYAAPSHEGPHGVVARMMADLRHALAQKPRLHVGIVQDNAPELWNLMREAFRAEPCLKKRRWRETVDFYHLIEHLGRLLEILVASERRRDALLERWRASLLRNDRAIYPIRRWLDRALAATKSRNAALPAHGSTHGRFLQGHGATPFAGTWGHPRGGTT